MFIAAQPQIPISEASILVPYYKPRGHNEHVSRARMQRQLIAFWLFQDWGFLFPRPSDRRHTAG